MSIYRFITPDELSDLPDDPALAFAEFAFIADKRLSELSGHMDLSEQNEWRVLEELQHNFVNVVIAVAKRFEIEPFTAMEVPQLDKFKETAFKQFKSDLDHYLTQLALDSVIRGRRQSVEILPKSKEQIRQYVFHLRQCVDSSNMTDAKREALLKKLDAFEAELEKRRLNLVEVSIFAMTMLALPGGVWQTGDIANKLVTNILQTVGEAKAADDETRQLPPAEVPKALSPPRKAIPNHTQMASAFDSDLDDDVPF